MPVKSFQELFYCSLSTPSRPPMRPLHRPLFEENRENVTASDLEEFPDLLQVNDEVAADSPVQPAPRVLQQIQNLVSNPGKMFSTSVHGS